MGKTLKRGSRRDAIADDLDGIPTTHEIVQTPPAEDPPDGYDERTPEEAPQAPPADVRLTLGAWDYVVRVSPHSDGTADVFDVSAFPRRRATRVFAARGPMVPHSSGPLHGLALNPGAHALYALSGQGKSRTLAALHARVGAIEAAAHYADIFSEVSPVSVVIPRNAACVAAQAGEPDGRYDPLLGAMAAAIAWALRSPGRLVTIDSVTDLSRVSGDGGTMSGGLSSGFATDLRHMAAALAARGSAALLVVNPLAEGQAAGLFREALFGSLTGLWTPTELGASAPTGQQRGVTRGTASAMWGSAEPAQRSTTAPARHNGLLVPALTDAGPTFGIPFGNVTRPFTY